MQKLNDVIKQIESTERKDWTDAQMTIMAAYWYGQHVGSKKASDKYTKVLEAQLERVKKERFKNVAKRVQGNISYIYDSSYGDNEIGFWEVAV